MKHVDEQKLIRIVSEEVEKPGFPAEEFSDLLEEIGAAASSTVKACMLAIALFNDTKKALQFKFSGSRVVFRKESVCNAFERYIQE